MVEVLLSLVFVLLIGWLDALVKPFNCSDLTQR
jgi:hypothetical protein